MSKYTIELRKICGIYGRDEVENWFKDYKMCDYLTQDEIEVIENSGLFKMDKLARKIVDHYYMREIAFETPMLFKHYAKVYMQEIMERKLPLIYSNSIKYDPLVNVDYQEEFIRNVDTTGKSESSSNSSSSGLGVNSDTPQGEISKTNILEGKYASNTSASETESQVEDNSNSQSNTDENYTKHVIGNSGVSTTAQKLVEQFRQNIIAIDEEIIKELNKLFFGLY